uniref:Uncharacterized protein n=1 Tax=Rhizophora mucronata TaxID=61149 RepID=A0A2P2R374_RHIMU
MHCMLQMISFLFLFSSPLSTISILLMIALIPNIQQLSINLNLLNMIFHVFLFLFCQDYVQKFKSNK